jgi:hypothetical protein
MKLILFVHRYLAVAVGLLMVLWCLSGFVMMYQSYPALENEARLRGLAPLELSQCCDLAALALEDTANVPGFRIEMLLGDPILRVGGGGRRDPALGHFNLRTGQPLEQLPESAVLQVARQFGEGNGITGEARSLGVIDVDQWTIQTAGRNQPAYHIAFDDAAATEIYISGATGEVFQHTNRKIRILSWLGAIPHWLYPTVLRQNGAAWTQVVIWTAIAGTFLAATGVYVGLMRLRRSSRSGQLVSPYRGWWYWHHISGLVFGVLALTWVFSGLMTMNPWNTLTGGADNSYRNRIIGNASWREVKQFLAASNTIEEQAYRQLQPAIFDSKFYVLASAEDGEQTRFDARGNPALLSVEEVTAVVERLDAPVTEFTQLTEEDAYYYGHKRDAALPVYRVLVDDAGKTRLYIDNATGSVRTLGETGRISRWLRTGLHDMDFPLLRTRPAWYIVVSVLLLGVTTLCVTGTWLAIQRVRMDWKLFGIRRRRRLAGASHAAFD